MMKTVYLIRHSAPFVMIDNYDDYQNVSWDDYNRNMILSSLGEENAKKLCDIAELNNIGAIYSSDSYRAIGTSKYLAEKNNLKIKLDNRLNERKLGCEKISDLPLDFSRNSFDNKDLKFANGESLNEVDSRFNSFLNDVLDSADNNIVLVIHGMILMSYLKSVCDFNFDGNNFKISFNNIEVMNGRFKNPDVFKICFEDKKVVSIENIN